LHYSILFPAERVQNDYSRGEETDLDKTIQAAVAISDALRYTGFLAEQGVMLGKRVLEDCSAPSVLVHLKQPENDAARTEAVSLVHIAAASILVSQTAK
jgi:hypothetical protein